MKTIEAAAKYFRVQRCCTAMPEKAFGGASADTTKASREASFAGILNSSKAVSMQPTTFGSNVHPSTKAVDIFAGFADNRNGGMQQGSAKAVDIFAGFAGNRNGGMQQGSAALPEAGAGGIPSETRQACRDASCAGLPKGGRGIVSLFMLFRNYMNPPETASEPNTEQTKNCSPTGSCGTNRCLSGAGSAATLENTWNRCPELWMKFDDTPAPVGYEYRYNPQTNQRIAVKIFGTQCGQSGCA